jgi:ribonuclease HII
MGNVTPDLTAYETGLASAGYHTIVGIDEVGRGALAGPIVAAAVVLPDDVAVRRELWQDVCDSKTLSAARREQLADHIHTHALHLAVAEVGPETIDEIGIGPANRLVMEIALREVETAATPDFVLLDAVTIDTAHPQIGIIDGDALCLSIAAASIVAKVHRDAIMTDLAVDWPHYGWERNKGYGVVAHLAGLRDVGPCPHHRFSFRPVRDATLVAHG